VDTGGITHTLEHESSVVCVCFSADGDLLASATANRVTQWDAGSGKSLLVLDTTGHEPLALAFRSDGLTLVSASADGSITSWDTRKGTVRNTLALEGAPFDVLAISADARRIAIFEPKGQAEHDEYDPRQIARDLAADRDLMDAFRNLKTAMANPGLRHTVMTTLRALARSTDE
jgi:WD40 repeat protein